MSLEFTILGCGSSGGVPRVGQGWGSCDPDNPRNYRLRCSLLVRKQGPGGITTVLVDTSPDLRQQLLAAQVNHLDGIVYTHEHADHTHGIDDLRGLYLVQKERLKIHANAATLAMLRQSFGYCFEAPMGSDYPPILKAHEVHPLRPLTIEGAGGPLEVLPVPVKHGDIEALGLRLGGLMYTPDLNGIAPEFEPYFHGLDVWLIDALREKQHRSHFSLNNALAAIEKFAPKKAILVNLHNDMDYARLSARLPENIIPAYDMFQITL